jgi:hypothetical protein
LCCLFRPARDVGQHTDTTSTPGRRFQAVLTSGHSVSSPAVSCCGVDVPRERPQIGFAESRSCSAFAICSEPRHNLSGRTGTCLCPEFATQFLCLQVGGQARHV